MERRDTVIKKLNKAIKRLSLTFTMIDQIK